MKYRYLFVALTVAGFTAPAVSADHPSGEAIAYTCAGCHGTDGRSQGVAPELYGEDADDLYEMMLEFKTDKEEGTIMNRIAKGYSDPALRAVSEYFASIED
jgi:sulfide dehydrogenase cytochrome subunit